jgi:hypothetical protein
MFRTDLIKLKFISVVYTEYAAKTLPEIIFQTTLWYIWQLKFMNSTRKLTFQKIMDLNGKESQKNSLSEKNGQ